MGIAESALHLDELPCFGSREMFTNQSLEDIHIYHVAEKILLFRATIVAFLSMCKDVVLLNGILLSM
jgi:hypothetical protein